MVLTWLKPSLLNSSLLEIVGQLQILMLAEVEAEEWALKTQPSSPPLLPVVVALGNREREHQ